MYDLMNLPGPGDFSPPDPECQLYVTDESDDVAPGIQWCLEHDQEWSECGGQEPYEEEA